MPQIVKSPADYCFEWTSPTPDSPMGDYTWDRAKAHAQALRDRNQIAITLSRSDHNPRSFSIRDQTITLGGIGSGHPQIELAVTIYGLNY